SMNALLLIALKVASGPSFLNLSCTRRTIAMASSRVPNSAADTESRDVAPNEASKIRAPRRIGARRMDIPLILVVQDWWSSRHRRKEAVLASGVPSGWLLFEAPQRHRGAIFFLSSRRNSYNRGERQLGQHSRTFCGVAPDPSRKGEAKHLLN